MILCYPWTKIYWTGDEQLIMVTNVCIRSKVRGARNVFLEFTGLRYKI